MEIIIYLLSVIVMVLSAILGFIINRQNNLEKEMKEHRQDVHNAVMSLTNQVNNAILIASKDNEEIKSNYLDRFKELKDYTSIKLDEVRDSNNHQFSEIKGMLIGLKVNFENHIKGT